MTIVALRNAIRDGIAIGARIFTAGKPIGTTGGHADPTDGCGGLLQGDPGRARASSTARTMRGRPCAERYKEGEDLIKIMATGGVLTRRRVTTRR